MLFGMESNTGVPQKNKWILFHLKSLCAQSGARPTPRTAPVRIPTGSLSRRLTRGELLQGGCKRLPAIRVTVAAAPRRLQGRGRRRRDCADQSKPIMTKAKERQTATEAPCNPKGPINKTLHATLKTAPNVHHNAAGFMSFLRKRPVVANPAIP